MDVTKSGMSWRKAAGVNSSFGSDADIIVSFGLADLGVNEPGSVTVHSAILNLLERCFWTHKCTTLIVHYEHKAQESGVINSR